MSSTKFVCKVEDFSPLHREQANELEVLKIIQTFHPTGVGARDLRECLLLQLERDGKQVTFEHRIVSECMEALGKRHIHEIARTLDTTVEEVQSAIARIASLEPRPGRGFLPENNIE